MSGGEPLTEREYEEALRTFQAVWEGKHETEKLLERERGRQNDTERQLGDERRRTEKLRKHIEEQVVVQEGLREELRTAQREREKQERRSERDRETIKTLQQQLDTERQRETERQTERERSCQRCSQLQAKVRELQRAREELERVRAYGKELQDLESASQLPSLAAVDRETQRDRETGRDKDTRSPAGTLQIHREDRYSETEAGPEKARPADDTVPVPGGRSRLKLSKKHRSDQFESLGSEPPAGYTESQRDRDTEAETQRDGAFLPRKQAESPAAQRDRETEIDAEKQREGACLPRKKRCVSPTFDETEQQLSQSSQPSQPILDTPALLDEDDAEENYVPTRGSQRETPRETARETDAAQEDSMALLLDEVAKPALTERGKENTLPAHRSASVFNAHTEAQRQTETERQSETKRQRATGRQGHFNVSSPRPSPVNHGCDEPTERDKETDRRRLKAGAVAPVAVAKETGDGTDSPAPVSVPLSVPLSTSQTQLSQHSPDLFPEEDSADDSDISNQTEKETQGNRRPTKGGSSFFKVKLRARTPFTQSQRS